MTVTRADRKVSPKPTRRSERLRSSKSTELAVVKHKKNADTKKKRFYRPKQRKSCRLLNLPGELRNAIYRFAIVKENDDTWITAQGPGEPALLRVCRQIRHETREMYYTENKFAFHLHDYDGAPIVPVFSQLVSVAREHPRFTLEMVGRPNWTNLLKWLKAMHAVGLGVSMPQQTPGVRGTSNELVVDAMFKILRGLMASPWTQVEAILEAAHQAVTAIHACWN